MKSKKKIGILLLILIVIILMEYYFGVSYYIISGRALEWVKELRDENYTTSVVIYLLFTFLGSSLLVLPGITFALMGGLIFGPYVGTILCVVGASLGATLSFIMGRYFLKDTVKPWVLKNQSLKTLLFDSKGKNYIYLLLITRLIPLFPFNLQNYAYGITDIPFSTYTIFSTLFILPGTAIYTFSISGLLDENKRVIYITLALILLLALTIIGKGLRKRIVMDKNK